MTTPLALYLHIPFCAVRCHYCDFNTYAGLDGLFERYATALSREIQIAGAARGRPTARTIFIGGGTPTVLSSDLLARILAACRDAFDIAPDAEITSEANPGTVDQERFSGLQAMGVNRLSMGVQSFDDEELRWLGRIHGAAEAETAFSAARAAGFTNINLDFIFGLPDQRPDTWARTLRHAVELGPEHLSLYSLIVEHGTPLADQVRRGLISEPDDDLAADMYSAASESLAASGYAQYEISNWAKDGRRQTEDRQFPSVFRPPSSVCQHNLVYWRREPYLGFGAGAHSFEPERRWWHVRPVPEYIRRVESEVSPEAGSETIDRRTAMGEAMMLGLRLTEEGMPTARFAAQFGETLEGVFGHQIARLANRGLLERLPDRVRLTAEGRLLGNQVFAEFLPEE
jgi:oxygen-independent coproporphyrinogen III oxidase